MLCVGRVFGVWLMPKTKDISKIERAAKRIYGCSAALAEAMQALAARMESITVGQRHLRAA